MAIIITRVHCSAVDFILPLMSSMFQVELTHVSASLCLHRYMAITVDLLLSTWLAFVVNRIRISVLCLFCFLLTNWNNSSLFALFRSFCHFAPLSWGILDKISVCHPTVSPQLGGLWLETFHPTYHKLYPPFCRLKSADSPWVVACASRPTHQTHKHTGILPGELWLAY